MLLSNSEFLKELTNLFQSRQLKGSIFLSTKRLTYESPEIKSTEKAREEGEGEDIIMQEASTSSSKLNLIVVEKLYPVLIRATDGQEKKSKIKFSTLVQPKDQPTFSTTYGLLLKSLLSPSLRKKKKSKSTTSTTHSSTTSASKKSTSSTTTTTAVGVGGGFKFRLPKIIGPMRGAGVKKRLRSIKRREKMKKVWIGRMKRAERERENFERVMSGAGIGREKVEL